MAETALSPNNTSTMTLLSLPYQLIIDTILPNLDLRSLLQLRLTSKILRSVVDDQVFWRRKIAIDYNFPIKTASARQTGWQSLYRGLSQPEIFVWGERENDRLGLQATHVSPEVASLLRRHRVVPFPIQLELGHTPPLYEGSWRANDEDEEREPLRRQHGINIGSPVQLHAGGWSFYALTTEGQVLAWGSANGGNVSTDTMETFTEPTILDLGDNGKALSLSVGRSHAVAHIEGERRSVVEWNSSWDDSGKFFVDDLLRGAGISSVEGVQLAQLEAGWDFSTILVRHKEESNLTTEEGDSSIIYWKAAWSIAIEDSGPKTSPLEKNVFPILLPKTPETTAKIAAGEDFIIALSTSGNVFILNFKRVERASARLRNQPSLRDAMQLLCQSGDQEAQWVLLRNFCQPDAILASGNYNLADSGDEDASSEGTENINDNIWHREGYNHLINDKTQITHVSAQFRSFAVYAPESGDKDRSEEGQGIVLLGTADAIESTRPEIVPDLQGQGVIKVTQGDWHTGALTRDGRALAWGSWSRGALGIWDAIPVLPNAPSIYMGSRSGSSRQDTFAATPTVPRTAEGLFARIRSRAGRALGGIDDAPPVTQVERLQVGDQQDHGGNVSEGEDPQETFLRERFRLRMTPDSILEPTQVRFGFQDHDLKNDQDTKFVFDLAFAGWHSGALAIDKSLIGTESLRGGLMQHH